MRSSEVGNTSIALSQVRQNLSARRISERSESSIQRGGRIFNHLVNYLTESSLCANIFSSESLCVEAFVSNAFAFRARHKRHSNNSYLANASLFTTYGILVGSPP